MWLAAISLLVLFSLCWLLPQLTIRKLASSGLGRPPSTSGVVDVEGWHSPITKGSFPGVCREGYHIGTDSSMWQWLQSALPCLLKASCIWYGAQVPLKPLSNAPFSTFHLSCRMKRMLPLNDMHISYDLLLQVCEMHNSKPPLCQH